MRNIKNIQLRKLLRDKRFTTTVKNWGTKSTTYNYRITNIKEEWSDEDPTCSNRNWYKTVINIVCTGFTTNYRTKKHRPGCASLTDEERIDRRYNPVIQDCYKRGGEWAYNLHRGWGNPREPRREVRYALLQDEHSYGHNTRRANDLRDFLKHVGISGELKIGTIKLEPTPDSVLVDHALTL
jgi:hypothetical protein